jgi:hypothetical protein
MSEINHVESAKKIYWTTVYGNFKFLKGNREINEAKVKKIVADIQSGIDFLSSAPIIVNEKMEIIDGQHRYAVAMSMKKPIHYIIHDSADLNVVPAINSKSSKWRTVDFLNSYVDLKKPAYLKLQDFLNNNLRVSLPVAIKLLHDGHMKGENTIEAFRDGLFVYKHEPLAVDLFSMLSDLEPYTINPFSSRFINVMLSLRNNGKYDHKTMLEKLEQSGYKIENIDSPKAIVSNMEQIYNFRMKSRFLIA